VTSLHALASILSFSRGGSGQILGNLAEVAGTWVIWAAAVIGAAGILFKKVVAVVRFFQRLAVTMDVVATELKPNGGSSLRDAVNRIETRLDDHIEHHREGV
jgi:phage-related minor tail protein